MSHLQIKCCWISSVLHLRTLGLVIVLKFLEIIDPLLNHLLRYKEISFLYYTLCAQLVVCLQFWIYNTLRRILNSSTVGRMLIDTVKMLTMLILGKTLKNQCCLIIWFVWLFNSDFANWWDNLKNYYCFSWISCEVISLMKIKEFTLANLLSFNFALYVF